MVRCRWPLHVSGAHPSTYTVARALLSSLHGSLSLCTFPLPSLPCVFQPAAAIVSLRVARAHIFAPPAQRRRRVQGGEGPDVFSSAARLSSASSGLELYLIKKTAPKTPTLFSFSLPQLTRSLFAPPSLSFSLASLLAPQPFFFSGARARARLRLALGRPILSRRRRRRRAQPQLCASPYLLPLLCSLHVALTARRCASTPHPAAAINSLSCGGGGGEGPRRCAAFPLAVPPRLCVVCPERKKRLPHQIQYIEYTCVRSVPPF